MATRLNGHQVLVSPRVVGFIEFQGEIADPAAPATNNSRVYIKDSGGSKTQFAQRFATGAVQVATTEP